MAPTHDEESSLNNEFAFRIFHHLLSPIFLFYQQIDVISFLVLCIEGYAKSQ